MLIALISDVHGNLLALERTLAAAESAGCAEVWCLGDIVGYPGGEPLECIELVREHCNLVVAGNHDAGASGLARLEDFAGIPAAQAGIERIRTLLDSDPRGPELRAYLRELPLELQITTPAGPLFLAHASPLNQLWHTVTAAGDYWRCFAATPRAVLVLGGHTHRGSFCIRTATGALDHTSAWARKGEGIALERWTFANPGSVGAPADAVGDAEWAILEISADGTPLRLSWQRTSVRP